ncbi:hypothetical protein CEXT_496191 [Caerostris extrusa]|uniref:Uncharacterized protein n=1 Tax=Caerostris extrusa TaxID=172846 RepID=A0AAV4TCH2_CAEEX|nr:hypothetical protein CEXT_496191 [Caerostris extrusa]
MRANNGISVPLRSHGSFSVSDILYRMHPAVAIFSGDRCPTDHRDIDRPSQTSDESIPSLKVKQMRRVICHKVFNLNTIICEEVLKNKYIHSLRSVF